MHVNMSQQAVQRVNAVDKKTNRTPTTTIQRGSRRSQDMGYGRPWCPELHTQTHAHAQTHTHIHDHVSQVLVYDHIIPQINTSVWGQVRVVFGDRAVMPQGTADNNQSGDFTVNSLPETKARYRHYTSSSSSTRMSGLVPARSLQQQR